jgi:hypothetical protein
VTAILRRPFSLLRSRKKGGRWRRHRCGFRTLPAASVMMGGLHLVRLLRLAVVIADGDRSGDRPAPSRSVLSHRRRSAGRPGRWRDLLLYLTFLAPAPRYATTTWEPGIMDFQQSKLLTAFLPHVVLHIRSARQHVLHVRNIPVCVCLDNSFLASVMVT